MAELTTPKTLNVTQQDKHFIITAHGAAEEHKWAIIDYCNHFPCAVTLRDGVLRAIVNDRDAATELVELLTKAHGFNVGIL